MAKSLRELSGEIVAELVEVAAANRWKEHTEYNNQEDRKKRQLILEGATGSLSANVASSLVSDMGPLRIAREMIDSCNGCISYDVRNYLKRHYFTLKFSGGYSLVQVTFLF